MPHIALVTQYMISSGGEILSLAKFKEVNTDVIIRSKMYCILLQVLETRRAM